MVLAVDSLVDQTARVQANGTVSLTLNSQGQHARHHLFAYYQYQDLAKNLNIQSNTTGSIFDNGSYTVDHFSSRGAETTKNFWETHILNDTEIKSLLQEIGTYGWEDSLEIKSNISWTPSLPEKFEKMHGYSLAKYLPLVMYGNNNPGEQPSYPGAMKCVLGSEDGGAGFVNDFRETLAQGYGEYLSALTKWLEGLGLQYSAQVSYNFPLDMETNIDRVNAPECESLAFNNNIDGYRQFSGAANVAQKSVISNEMGADQGKALALPISELLGQINYAFAGGINQVVLHGQTFTGDYPETTWPGYLAFFLLFSESYMDKQPDWKLGLPDAIGYINRNQYVLHQGQPRTDVAFYNKVSYTDPQLGTRYSGSDLINAGYTYTYLNPTNLNLTDAYVSKRLLAPEAPAYQAMVITAQQNMTLEAVSKIQKFADDGLPIVFSGRLPGYFASGNNSEETKVSRALHQLQNSPNVHTAASGQLAAKLEDLKIRPRIQVVTYNNASWYPVLRSEKSTEYVFIFSKDTAGTGHIVVNSTKTPYVLNSWTGERSALLNYQVRGSTTKIPLTLGANQTTILAFTNDWKSEIDTPSAHVVQAPSNALGYSYTASKGLVINTVSSTGSSNRTLKLSNGNTQALGAKNAAPSFQLTNWTLVAEHWQAPKNMSDVTTIAKKHNATHHLHSPVSWLDIPGLHNASGVGYYSTQFTWPPSAAGGNGSDGAYLSLPQISHGLKLFVNGHAVQTLDFAKPLVDLEPFLHRGSNKVLAVVPTLMWNYIRSIFSELKMSGSPPMLSSLPSNVDAGLIGDVRVVPYTKHHVPV